MDWASHSTWLLLLIIIVLFRTALEIVLVIRIRRGWRSFGRSKANRERSTDC
jgi:hypothetical protein